MTTDCIWSDSQSCTGWLQVVFGVTELYWVPTGCIWSDSQSCTGWLRAVFGVTVRAVLDDYGLYLE